EFFPAGHRGHRGYILPARDLLEVDLDADFGCGGEVLGVGGEAIRDIDHRADTVIGEPEAGLDPGLRARIAVAEPGGHFIPRAEMLERSEEHTSELQSPD